MKKIILCVALFVYSPVLVLAATTIVDSSVSTSTIWTKAGSPYLVSSSIYVEPEAALTLQPGAVVRFSHGAGLTVGGTLNAVGTPQNKIVFTSANDNSTSDWKGLSFISSISPVSLNNVIIRYSTNGIFLNHSNGDFQNIEIATSSSGISLYESGLSILNSNFHDLVGTALSAYSTSTLSIASSTFVRIKGQSAISVFNNSRLDLDTSLIQNSSGPSAISFYNNQLSDVGLSISNSTLDNGTGDGLMIYNDGRAVIASSTIKNFQKNGIEEFSNGSVNIKNSIVSNNRTGISFNEATLDISTSSIKNNSDSGLVYNGSSDLLAKNIWWGDSTGPYNQLSNASGTANKISGNVIFSPWLLTDPFLAQGPVLPIATGSSNVIFLPGIESSRLYTKNLLSENQLWEPNRNADAEKLYLNNQGIPIDQNIYTRDIIERTNIGGGLFDKDIYKNFSHSMDQLVDDGIINAWEPIPYDWRMPLGDIIANGIRLQDKSIYLIPEIQRMASSSKTGKVTIITHSNGGLLAKTLIDTLRSEGKAGVVDKLIMVAPPELGTPKAIGGLLHGDDQDIPIIMNKSVARGLGENMTSAYNLLPSKRYFETVSTPVIQFDPSVDKVSNFRAKYGDNIKSSSALSDFLLAKKDQRIKPSMADTDSPNILNAALVDRATAAHGSIDNWVPPTGLKVAEIAGWGISTTRGLEYSSKEDCLIGGIICSYSLDHSPLKTLDGDGTVVSPSVMKSGTKVYLNIHDYNVENKKNIDHSNIFEAKPLTDFIANIIKNKPTILPINFSPTKPATGDSPNFQVSVHSPVSLDAYDMSGNHTGIVTNTDPASDVDIIEANIPNSSYEEMGEGKYVTLGDNQSKLKINGLGIGSFSLNIGVFKGDNKVREESFTDIPTTPLMTGELTIAPISSSFTPLLKIDSDGNGSFDTTLSPSTEIEPKSYLLMMKNIIVSLHLAKQRESTILSRIDAIINLLTQNKIKNATKKIRAFNHNLGLKAAKIKDKKHSHFQPADIESLAALLNELLDSLASS